MGRELKRVSMGFMWPLNKTWEGYLNPWYRFRFDCPACGGTGASAEANRFRDEWYGNAPFDPVAYGSSPVLTIDSPILRESVVRKLKRSAEIAKEDGNPDYYTRGGSIPFEMAVRSEIHRMFGYQSGQWMHQITQADVDALVDADRLYYLTHEFVQGTGWMKREPPINPTAEQVNTWSFFGFGHDSINQWVCVKARCIRSGVEETCLRCNGDGDFWEPNEMKSKAEEWQPIEPPPGEGWQLWQTTSEGGPVSPVFGSAQELADWCAINATVFGSEKTTRDNWLKMFEKESGVEAGSFFIRHGDYVGAAINEPTETDTGKGTL